MTSTDQPVHIGTAAVRELESDREATEEARTALADQVLVGEQVLQSARIVGDERDAAMWQVSRQAWIGSAAAALQAVFPAALDEFRLACHATVRGRWRSVFEAEVRAVEDGLELISSLLGTPGPSR